MKPTFLDHNSTTVMEQGAKATLLFFSSTSADDPNFGNPSSVHWAGRRVKSAVDDAREEIATAFGIDYADGLLFTGSATESINTALKGFYFQDRAAHYITSAVEHEATLESLRFLETLGAKVTVLPVNSAGQLNLADLESALASSTGPKLVSLMASNNETGVVFPWEEAARLARSKDAIFHLDAVQAPGKIADFALRNGPVDMASFSAHKIGGPKGVGALYVRRGVKLESLLHGGAQERKRRAGTVNVAGIASFGAAARNLTDPRKVLRLRELLEREVKQRIQGVSVQGEASLRISNTSNFLFDGVRGEGLLMGLDLEGFAVSSGSACNSGSILPSHVLQAMGMDKVTAASAVRVSLGRDNTEEEVRSFVEALEKVVGRIRARK